MYSLFRDCYGFSISFDRKGFASRSVLREVLIFEDRLTSAHLKNGHWLV